MLADFEKQIATCDAVLATDPKDVQQYSKRGDAHLFLGQPREAVADGRKMIAIDPAQDAALTGVSASPIISRATTRNRRGNSKNTMPTMDTTAKMASGNSSPKRRSMASPRRARKCCRTPSSIESRFRRSMKCSRSQKTTLTNFFPPSRRKGSLPMSTSSFSRAGLWGIKRGIAGPSREGPRAPAPGGRQPGRSRGARRVHVAGGPPSLGAPREEFSVESSADKALRYWTPGPSPDSACPSMEMEFPLPLPSCFSVILI